MKRAKKKTSRVSAAPQVSITPIIRQIEETIEKIQKRKKVAPAERDKLELEIHLLEDCKKLIYDIFDC